MIKIKLNQIIKRLNQIIIISYNNVIKLTEKKVISGDT